MVAVLRTTAEKRQLGAKIAAIEGISLTPEIAELFARFDAENRSASERIKLIHEYFENTRLK